MSQAVGLVAAYDMGEEKGNYHTFARLSQEAHDDEGLDALRATAQFAWMLLESMDSAGVSKEEVLGWYGMKFASRAEELRPEDADDA